MTTTDQAARFILIAVPAAALLACALPIYNCTLDDSFISFRYARNLACGAGLVFNKGELTEGFSNPSWVFLMAFFHRCGFDIVCVSKILGLVFAGMTLAVLSKLSRDTLKLSYWTTLSLLCFLATNISFAYYAISGMETVFYMFLIVLMNYLLSKQRYLLAGFVCSIISLTRPEGILFVMPLGLATLIAAQNRLTALKACAIPVIAYTLLFFFRVLYFGDFLPHTHAAKIGSVSLSIGWLIQNTKAMILYTIQEQSVGLHILVLSAIGAAALAGRRTIPQLGSIGCAAFFIWYSRSDWMSFWRFYLPVLPFIAAFAFATLDLVKRTLSSPYRHSFIITASTLLIVLNILSTAGSIRALNEGEGLNPAMHSRPHIAIGKYLAEHSGPDDIVVVNEIGAIGYYSELRIIDMLGLTDRSVTSLLQEGTLDEYAAYILGQSPTYIMLNDKQNPTDTQLHPWHAAIYDKMQSSKLYIPGPVYPLNSYKNLMVFVRKETGHDGTAVVSQ